MRFWKILLVLVAMLVVAPNFSQASGYAFPVAGAPFRAGARALVVTTRVALLPAKALRAVHNNSLERRAARGNCFAAARLSAKSARGAY